MPCYAPLQAWRGSVGKSGKRSIVFQRPVNNAAAAFPLKLPCGQCIGCRLERSRQWAVRCMDEAQMWEKNCFITLTYDEEHLPAGGSLDKREFQLFIKKLRKEYGEGIRYFHCGEYGETNGRPHYHACLFNIDFPDKRVYAVNANENTLYNSETLNRIWGKGFAIIGEVTFESAAYVARYVLKKVTGEKADEHYTNKETGEIMQCEYVTMSRGSAKLGTGGIGKTWFDRYKGDIYPRDEKIVRGVVTRPPRYYDEKIYLDNPEMFAILKAKRQARMDEKDNDSFRLRDKEESVTRKIKNLVREI